MIKSFPPPPPEPVQEGFLDVPYIAKSPTRDTFPLTCPEGCTRNCNRFFEAHTVNLSLALYSSQTEDKKIICAYGFTCGLDIHGERFHLKDNETLRETVYRVIPVMIKLFEDMAINERQIHEESGKRVNQ